MEKKKKSAIRNIVVGFIGDVICLVISIANNLTDTQEFLLAIVMAVFGFLFALGLINLSAVNSYRKK